jgi:hypothetical protein
MQLATYVTVSFLGYFFWLNGNILHNELKCRAPILTCDKYKSSLKRIHDPVLLALKVKGVRLPFWNPKFYYCLYNSPLLVPILRQIGPIHTVPNNLFKIYFNIVFPPTPSFSQVVYFLQFCPAKPCRHALRPHTCHVFLPYLSSWFDSRSNTWRRVRSIQSLLLLSSRAQMSSLLQNTPSLCSVCNVRDQVSIT